MNLQIITQSEQIDLFKSINETRKILGENKNEEQKLSELEKSLGNSLMICRKIRERWNSLNVINTDKIMEENKTTFDILSKE